MPYYDYHCLSNGKTVEVNHSADTVIRNWGKLCFAAQCPLGETDPLAPVSKVLQAVAIITPTSDSELKSKGFTKLVKRDTGVYENVTALDGEKRYMEFGDPSSIPDLKKRIRD